MAERHDPIVTISDRGAIEVGCTCGRMEIASGRKQACRSAWDSHLVLKRVRPQDAGSLNLILNALTDPELGPVTWRDLSRFPPEVAARIRAGRQAATTRPTPPSPGDQIEDATLPDPAQLELQPPEPETNQPPAEPPLEPVGTDSAVRPKIRRKAPFGPGIVEEPESPGPQGVRFNAGSERYRREQAVLVAFFLANRVATEVGFPSLPLRYRRRLTDAMALVAASDSFDLFRFPRLLAQYAVDNDHSEWALYAAIDETGQILAAEVGARWRVREMINLVGERDRIWLTLPPGWQRILVDYPD